MPQETFPRVDLKPENASLLSLMLANLDLLRDGHQLAELYPLYELGHPAQLCAGGRLENSSSDVLGAFDRGIRVYEAIAGLVRLRAQEYNLRELKRNSASLAVVDKSNLYDYLEEAEANFKSNLPNTLAVVDEAAGRFHPQKVAYAIYGVALACQFEIDTADGTLLD